MTDDPYGFGWGPMRVVRYASFQRPTGLCRVLGIEVGKKRLHVYVSPTGRSVRVYLDGKELT